MHYKFRAQTEYISLEKRTEKDFSVRKIDHSFISCVISYTLTDRKLKSVIRARVSPRSSDMSLDFFPEMSDIYTSVILLEKHLFNGIKMFIFSDNGIIERILLYFLMQ